MALSINSARTDEAHRASAFLTFTFLRPVTVAGPYNSFVQHPTIMFEKVSPDCLCQQIPEDRVVL